MVSSTTVENGVSKSKSNSYSLAIGGGGGTGGAGGDVTVTNVDNGSLYSGVVNTLGDGSHAIVAMSIGGGGGQGSSVTTNSRSKNGPSIACDRWKRRKRRSEW